MLSREWDKSSMELWKELREIVIKYPTANETIYNNYEIVNELYISCDKDINKYLYAQNGDFDASVKDTETKLEAASSGFLAIGESSVGTPQRLTEVFDERNRTSKSSIASAFEQMKTIGSSIQRKIDDLSRQISQLEQEMEDGKNRERYLNNVIAEQNHIMNNASLEMAYHKKYLNG